MSNCTDFEEEESLLQVMGRQMGYWVTTHQSVTVRWLVSPFNIAGVVQKMHK